MESTVTAILRDASGKMHDGIVFDRRLDRQSLYIILHYHLHRHSLVACSVLKGYTK